MIFSAGIGNFIEKFLKAKCLDFDNISIVSNFLKFESGVAVDVCGKIIRPFNKNEVSFNDEIISKVKGRNNVVIFGDDAGDAKMASDADKNIVKVGFLDINIEERLPNYRTVFDIVASNNASFDEVRSVMREAREERDCSCSML